MTQARRYCLITPCRDEQDLAKTLDTVAAQSEPPALWLIVDDGSTDQTPAILAEYAAKYPFIKILRRDDRGFRKLGGGVIDAFYHGYETINPNDFDYVCKIDLDLELPPKYFQSLMDRMERQPRIGTASGKPYFRGPNAGNLISEKCGDENSVGMIKFYRTRCFQQIGGFVRELMWDGIDGHRCRMLGWIAVSWDAPISISSTFAPWEPATKIGGPAASATESDNISWAPGPSICSPAPSIASPTLRSSLAPSPIYGAISKA